MKKSYKGILEKYITQKVSQAMFNEKKFRYIKQYEIDLSGIEIELIKDGDHIDIFDKKGNLLGDAFFTPNEDNGNKMSCFFSPKNIEMEAIRLKNGENYSDMIPEELITPKCYTRKKLSPSRICKISPELRRLE